jgi:hypothetical protein
MKMTKISRRRFLSASALTTASLPFLHLLRPPRARAASTVAPLRLILLSSLYQVPEPYFHPQVSSTNSALAPAGTSFYLTFPSSILAPLAPFQSNLIIVRGLQYSQKPGSHDSHTTLFTGTPVLNPGGGEYTTGTSIDNYLFGRMGQKGSLTPINAGCFFGDATFNWLNGIANDPINNPLDLYKSLFSNFTPPSGTSSGPTAAAKRRSQTLGLVQRYVNGLSDRLPSTSTSYSALQSHLSAAQGLAGQIGSPSAVGSTCSPPMASSIPNDVGTPPGSNGPPYDASLAPQDMASFIKMITQAFACDLTRFGSFYLQDGADLKPFINSMPGLESWSGTDFHGQVTHGTSGETTNPLDLVMAKFKTYYLTQVARLLTALQAVPDPFNPSQTLYDNTVVVIGNEGPIQAPLTDVHNNGTTDQMFIIAGGCGGYFKMGQLIFAGGTTKPNTNHNALLTNIVNVFERNQQQFNPTYTPNIISQYGSYSFSVSPTTWLT